ncbi:binary toxin-like calcium binding domain-containing protein [Bacillus solimangrovi]|uniref:PA14 domain-containing protein n=1 Tax=Bacillus solimangrovi TaxID=1305675 RepID=A0A1E5LI78_9BACI|nr:binary toxin-like calcium binding domain-containing protein [Bacillus solimangrovi]OEH93768.1 hypothetical protein BFG57_11330 [Bacillus solimangrovi]
MRKTKNRKRFVSVLTTLALTSQMLPFSPSTIYAKNVEDEPRETTSQDINHTQIITNGLEGAYYTDARFSDPLLIRMEDSDALYDLDSLNIPKVFKKKLENVHSIKWEGSIEPKFSEEYTFTTSDNEHIKLWVNDELLINGLNFDPQSIQLEAGELYHIRVAYSNQDQPLTDLDIKWSSDSQEEEIISKEHIFLPVHSEEEDNSISPEELIVDELEEIIVEPVEELLEIPEGELVEPTEELEEPVEEAEQTEALEEPVEEVESTEPTDEQTEEVETTEPTDEQTEEVESTEPTDEQAEEVEITEPTDEQTEEVEITEPTGEQAEEVESTDPTDEQTVEIQLTDESVPSSLTGSLSLLAVSDDDEELDSDSDGIPNTWEINGYTFSPLIGLMEWDDEFLTEELEKYVTSPLRFSTDGDPYSDYEEVTRQVDGAISTVATHPLVPAFPNIKAELDYIQITPNDTITLTDGTSVTEGWQSRTDHTDSTTKGLGAKVGTEATFEFEEEIAIDGGFKTTQSFKYYGEVNSHRETADITTTSDGENGSETANWSQAKTSNESQAATSIWNVKFTNTGTAPAYDIIPSLSLQIGNATAVSMETPNSQSINSLAPNNSYPSSGTIAMQYREVGSNDTIPLYLSLNQLKSIEMGLPITVSTDQIDAKVKRIENGLPSFEQSWNDYQADIDNVTANITFLSNTTGEHNFKVYANDPKLSSSNYDPEPTLGDALKLALDAKIENDNLYIYNEKVDDTWRIYFSSDSPADEDTFTNIENIYDMPLRPGMDITIEKPELDGKPYVQYALYGKDGKQIISSIFENGSSIDYVKAKVRTVTGELKTIDLIDEDENGEFDGIYESSNLAELLDLTYQNAEIEVRAANGEVTTTYILTPSDVTVRGLGYVPLASVKDVTDEVNTLPQKYPNAEAFVFEVKNTKTTTNMRRADIGNQRVYLGVNNYPTEYRAAATLYAMYDDKNYSTDDGKKRDYIVSSMSDLRSGLKYANSFNNKASSLKFEYGESGDGIVLYNFFDYRQQDDVLALTGSDRDFTDSTDWNNVTSSVRIIGQSGKPYVRLYENNAANKNTNTYGTDYVDVYGTKNISDFFNDKASSFQTFGGEDMNYYIDPTFRQYSDGSGLKQHWWNESRYVGLNDFNSSVNNLSNKVSYVKFECQYCPTFKLYKNKNYDNKFAEITPVEDVNRSSNLGNISSIKVSNNGDKLAKIIIYKENGNYAVIDSSVSDLSSFQDVVYKGKSSGTRNYNDNVVFAKMYYGAVYRFYTGKNYSGSYQDYIIGEDNIGSDWSNKFSSVKVLNPLPEIGLIAFDKTNYDYDGDFLPITGDIPDLSTVGFNDKISSLKLITRIPEKRPTHNTTVVVSSKDLSFEAKNKYFGEGTSVNLVGYFDRTEESSKFTPYEHNVSYEEKGSYSFDTGINDATGYLVQVDAQRVSSNKVQVKLNGTSYSELGTSPTHALGLEPGAIYDPLHSNVVFVPAKSNDPSQISVDISLGSWRATGDGGDEKYKIKVLGYFADDDNSSNDLFYEKFDTPIAVASPSITDERKTSVPLQTRDYKDTPKAYLVNVTGKNIGASNFKFSINDNYLYLGTSSSVDAKGVDARSVHHSGLMYVEANSDNAYLFEMTPNYGDWKAIDSDAVIDVEVVGYFY